MNIQFISALSLVVLLCSGCAALAPPPEFTETHCGKTVLMIPDRIEACPPGTSGCAWEVGTNAWAITYPSNSVSVKAHELEHVCGMMHRHPWVTESIFNVCTEVTKSGSTAWLPGQVMCRSISGDIRLEKNPSTVEKVRKLHAQQTNTLNKIKTDF